MAQLKEVPYVIKAIGAKEFTRRVWQQVSEDDVFTWAASLAYSWMFAVFPFLIFLLTLVPLLPAHARAKAGEDIDSALYQLPPSAAGPLMDQAHDLLNHPQGGLLSIGLLITIWAAAGGMSMTMTALDRCYDIRQGRTYIQQRIVAILLTLVVAVLIVAVMLLLPVASGLIAWFRSEGAVFGPVVWALNFARYGLAFVLMLAILALVYHFGLSLRQTFHSVTPGAVFSVTVWIILALAFRLYINKFGAASYNKTYGAVAGVAILLLFFYIDATVLLIGAEINSEVDFAVLGLPSSAEANAEAILAGHHTEEHHALLQELKEKRQPVVAPAARQIVTFRTAPAAAPRHKSKAVGILVAAGAAWAFFRALREARMAAVEKERLKLMYPATYRALWGDGGTNPNDETRNQNQ